MFSGLFLSSAHDALWHNETVKRSPVEAGAETKRGWEEGRGGVQGGVKWHHTRALYLQRASLTHRPIYSCQIFSQRLPHAVAPSQTQASDGTGGFTLLCAAKGNTPYPLVFSCANLTSLQRPSTLHTCTFRIFPTHPSVCFQPFSSLVSHRSVCSQDERKEEGI